MNDFFLLNAIPSKAPMPAPAMVIASLFLCTSFEMFPSIVLNLKKGLAKYNKTLTSPQESITKNKN